MDEYLQVLWLHDIPKEKGCFTQAWGRNEEYEEDIWIEIQISAEPELSKIPDICSDWVNSDTLLKTNDFPELYKTITKQIRNPAWKEGGNQPEFINQIYDVDRFPGVKVAWDRYIEQLWMPWAEQHEKWDKVHKIYATLFSMYQEQLRLGEEYELVLAIGLLTWQTPSNQRVRRHLIVANVLLEFEARLGKFTIRPNPDDVDLRPELDMLDIEEQPAHVEESAKTNLKEISDNPWNIKGIENVLKALVHSIKPNGEYYPNLNVEKTGISEKPIVQFSPAIILRKRSIRSLTDVLKRIKERIKNGEKIPPEFGDLAEIQQQEEEILNGLNDNSNVFADSEIWFPKPSNEEQYRIVEKIRNANGVLVQGPPGTGKSHTIANLICHFLATGQRTLITAKTPRAL
ncbi:MAG: AAA domain-containing protein, partial [bacterium]|nr:AAA domain-containing protein [bacterium]